MGETPASRIDDCFTNASTLARDAQVTVIGMGGSHTDHDALQIDLPFVKLNMLPPPDSLPDVPDTQRLRIPLSPDEMDSLRTTIDLQHGDAINQFDSRLQQIIEQEVYPYWDSLRDSDPSTRTPIPTLEGLTTRTDIAQLIDHMGEQLLDLLMLVRDTVMEYGPTVRTNHRGHHMYPRGVSQSRKKIKEKRKQIARAIRNQDPQLLTSPALKARLEEKQEEDPHQTPEQTLKAMKKELSKELEMIDREHTTLYEQERTQKLRALFDTKQKIGNKIMTGQYKGRNNAALHAIHTNHGLETRPHQLIAYTEHYFTKKMAPATGIKTGEYEPGRQPRLYPWAAEGAPDPFHLVTATTKDKTNRAWLHTHIQDSHAFTACLKTLSHGKAPGPDGVTNEMLQMLPLQGQALLHKFIQVMWATGYTPRAWKHSLTALLWKEKGTVLELKYYRRIGLECTIYKLWTRMITWAMADHAERNKLLTYTQGGFRNKRTTADQLELLTMLLEDARLHQQDIYLAMIDFTEAFDTIDHDNLLVILYDLGFPTDAIEVVKHLYTGATTSIKTPHGHTNPIPIDRGTIQGDSLSPFLFIVYLEPLLRWLRVGVNGYIPGVYQKQDALARIKEQIPDSTYADDLNILCPSVGRLQQQLAKITQYAQWAQLIVNIPKSMVTGARYHSEPKDPFNCANLKRILSDITLQHQSVPFHNPTTPFRYLGVHFTMHLDWTQQLRLVKTTLQSMARGLKVSGGTPYQKMRTIHTCIRSKVRYAFCVAPYTDRDIQELDSIISRACKAAHGLPHYLAQAFVHEDRHKGGLGCPSLQVEYKQVALQRLISCLNSTGPLGRLTRARMEQDQHCLDHMTARVHPTLARHSLRLRQQITCCGDLGLTINIGTEQAFGPLNPTQLLAQITAIQHLLHAAPPPLLLRDLHRMRKAGLTTVKDIMKPTGREVLTPKQISLSQGRKYTPTEQAAIKRVCHMLTQPPGLTPEQYNCRMVQNKPANTHIHPGHARTLRALEITPSADIRTALLTALPEVQRHPAYTHDSLSELQDHIRTLQHNHTRPRTSLRRSLEEQDKPLTRGTSSTGYGTYMQLTQKQPLNLKDRQRLEQLYLRYAEHVDQVDELVGTAVAASHRVKRRKWVTTAKQDQVVVSWKPTIMQGWVASIAKDILGYKVASARVATEKEIMDPDHNPIYECCNPHHTTQRRALEDTTAIVCDTCLRGYHVECLPHENQTHAQHAISMATEWTCTECSTHNWTAETKPKEITHYIITWEDSYEVKEGLLRQPEAWAPAWEAHLHKTQLADAASGHPTAPGHICPKPRGKLATAQAGLTSMQQQGDYYPDHPTRYDITIGQSCREKLIIHPHPMNPHTDIEPTGQHEVYLRDVHMRIDGRNATHPLACIYTPDGRCKHTLTVERAALLHHQYHQTLQRRPKLANRLQAGSFAKELYALMERYRDGAIIDPNNHTAIKLENHWATPKEVYRAIQRTTKITKERFASPLNYCPEFTNYWSIHKRDQLFGASWDTYRFQWTGGSVHNPEYEDQDLNKNVAMAVAAATHTEEPVFGIHILPAWTDCNKTAYMKWLEIYPEHCKHILQIPRAHFRFERPTAWGHGDRFAQNPRWDVNILVTGNKAGFQHHFPHWDPQFMNHFYHEMQTALNSVLPEGQQIAELKAHAPAPPVGAQQRQQPTPTLLRQLGYPARATYMRRKRDGPRQASRTPLPAAPHQDITWQRMVEVFRTESPPPPPLKYAWRDFTYTDGSCKVEGAPWPKHSPGIGAGVYIPAREGTKERKIPINPQSSHGNHEDTINRAELVGILTALQEGAIAIATDSLTSMYQIRKQLLRPQEHEDHKHQNLLRAITTLIRDSKQPINIYKVPAHCGIIGNEHADETAKAAAKGDALEEECRPYRHPSRTTDGVYWPVIRQETKACTARRNPPEETTHHRSQADPQQQDTVIVGQVGRPLRVMTRSAAKKFQEDTNRCGLLGRVFIVGDQCNAPTADNTSTEVQPTLARKRPLDNLKNDLKRICHEKFRLGKANRNTIYFEAWTRASGDRNDKDSNHFLTSNKVKFGIKKTVMKYRSGTLYNRKRAFWFKQADNSRCTLCGNEDGCHHTAAGCPALTQLYTHRHNTIGRILLRAISRGRKGAFVIQMDLGSDTHCRDDHLVPLPHRIPPEALPESLPPDVKDAIRKHSIPDAFLYKPATATERAEYWIVEIKFCRDTDRAGKLKQAREQHRGLYETLCAARTGARIHYMPLIMGVGGSIYNGTVHQLTKLGVNGRDLKNTVRTVHMKTTEMLHWIYTTKLKKERKRDPRAPWKRKRR